MTDKQPRGTGTEQGPDMSRIHLNDEILMAYADGELDPSVAATVERSVAEDSTVAVRITGFIRSRRLARAALEAALDSTPGPVPPALQEAIRNAPSATALLQGGGRGTAGRRRMERAARWMPRQRLAPVLVAASVAVIAGLVGYLSAPERAGLSPTSAGVLALLDDAKAGEVLSRLATGEAEVIGDVRVHAVGTYRLQDGAVCRDIALTGKVEAGEALACRGGSSGPWTLRVAVVEPAKPDTYAPAGGKDLVDAFLERAGAGSPVTGEAERALLSDLAP
jgi:anti-sigma factor RsiW